MKYTTSQSRLIEDDVHTAFRLGTSAVIFIAHLLPHTTSPSAHYCYHHYVPSVRFFFFLFFYTSPCLTPVGDDITTPISPTYNNFKAMDDILAEDPVY